MKTETSLVQTLMAPQGLCFCNVYYLHTTRRSCVAGNDLSLHRVIVRDKTKRPAAESPHSKLSHIELLSRASRISRIRFHPPYFPHLLRSYSKLHIPNRCDKIPRYQLVNSKYDGLSHRRLAFGDATTTKQKRVSR